MKDLKIKLDPLTAVLFVICFFMGEIRLLAVTYTVMAIHETAHLVSALCIGLRPQKITFAPFGVQLTLKNKIVGSLADEIILYASGPLINGALAVCGLIMGSEQFYRINISLFIINLMPVYPLDGGMIAKRILSYRFGGKTAETIMRSISFFLILGAASLAAASWYIGEFNMSLAVMSLFLIGNIITSSEKYDSSFINGISGAKKKSNRVKVVVIDENNSAAKAARSISPSFTTVAVVTDSSGAVSEIISEKELVERIL